TAEGGRIAKLILESNGGRDREPAAGGDGGRRLLRHHQLRGRGGCHGDGTRGCGGQSACGEQQLVSARVVQSHPGERCGSAAIDRHGRENAAGARYQGDGDLTAEGGRIAKLILESNGGRDREPAAGGDGGRRLLRHHQLRGRGGCHGDGTRGCGGQSACGEQQLVSARVVQSHPGERCGSAAIDRHGRENAAGARYQGDGDITAEGGRIAKLILESNGGRDREPAAGGDGGRRLLRYH